MKKEILLFERVFKEGLSRRELRRGQILFRLGDPATAIFGVESGRLRLVRHTVEGSPVTLAVAGAGEILAEAALFSENYHCDAVAECPSRVLVYPKSRVLEALRTDTDFALGLTQVLASQVRTLRARLELRNIRSARDRVLAYLSLHPRPVTPAGGRRYLKDMAQEVGLAPEVFYRTLARLQREGVVPRKSRKT